MFNDEPVHKMCEELFRKQAELNDQGDPDWHKVSPPRDYVLAMRMEAAEMIDHFGWKWWKEQEYDMEAIRMEIVDIWHFQLSELMVMQVPLSPAELADEILAYRANTTKGRMPKPFDDMKSILAGSASRTLWPLIRLTNKFFNTFEAMFSYYMAKNVLNAFRYEHGYKTGDYNKNWFFDNKFREDNEVCTMIMADMRTENIPPEKFAGELKHRLEIEYFG